ncbi:hypothetical protein HDU81_004976 [Chytriomyces hyalinus]|nr:hypothetical protein HDU81_004976 [Chytriomyces hyalinus]
MENKPLPALPPVICTGSNSSLSREWVLHPDGRRTNMSLTDWDSQYQVQGECVGEEYVGEDVPVASNQTGGVKPSFSQFMRGIWPESDVKKHVPPSVPPAATSATSQKHSRPGFLNRKFPGFKPSLIRTMSPADSLPAGIDDMESLQETKPQMSRTPSITSIDSCSFSFALSVRHTQASCTTTASHLHENPTSIFSFEIDGKDELAVDVSLWKTLNEERRSSAPEPPSLTSSTSNAAFTRRRQFSFANTSSPSPSFSRSLSAQSEMSTMQRLASKCARES